MIEKTDIGDLKGIGEKTKKLFEKINVHTVGDLIRYYPHGYDVYEEAVPISELEEDKIQTVTGAIYGRVQVSGSSRMQVTTLHVKDLTGTLKVIWFRMPFLRNTLSGGGVTHCVEESSVRKQAIWSWNIRRCSILRKIRREAAYITACIWSDGRIIQQHGYEGHEAGTGWSGSYKRDPAGFTAFEIWSGRIQLCGERNTFS